jgi:beta-N-acetylhexosaminidase
MPSSLDRDAASLLCVGFHGTTPSPEVLELVRRGVSGVILFSRNVESAEQVAELTAALKRAAGRPLLVAIDQEGGRVARLRAPQGFTELPPMRAVGATGDERLAFQVGALLGRELRAVGVDQDYAPVVDVDTNPGNPVIGDRALSRDPDVVGRLGAALARGLQAEGVAACAKHFPGHGDTSQDSHVDLPRLPHALERLRRVELPPFRALAQAGVAAVMTAHVVFEPLDPRRPATLSPAVMRLLRDELGFQGCCVSDDLEMKAVAEHFPLEEAAPGAVAAGVDQLLVCHQAELQHRAIDLVRVAVEAGRIPPVRLAEAKARVARLLSYAGPPPDPARVRAKLRTPEHLAFAASLPALAQGSDPTEKSLSPDPSGERAG